MNPRTWLATTLVLTAMASVRAQGLVDNSAFVNVGGDPPWPDAWTATSASAAERFRWVNDDGYTANVCLTVRGDAGQATDSVSQTVDCAVRTQYVLSAALKADGECVPSVRVLAAGSDRVLAQVSADGSGAWRVYSSRFGSGAQTRLEVRLTAAGSSGVGAVDAVQIHPADAVPAELEPRDWFTPPGPNLALGKSYRMQPRPNYSHCTDPGDVTQLTDGVYTSGYFWTQLSTVGWRARRDPVVITVDLGAVEPIAGASYNTAAGVADVAWPNIIVVLVSDDGKAWHPAGELVRETMRRAPPPKEGYAVHRFAASGWETRGRYVRFMVEQRPYSFVDEIEVYGGDPAWLDAPPPSVVYTDENTIREELLLRPRVNIALEWRLRQDLDTLRQTIADSPVDEALRTELEARAEALAGRIETLPEAPADLRSILPLSGLHTEIVALNAPLRRAAGQAPLTVWKKNRWQPLDMLEAPSPTAPPPEMEVAMIRGEVRGDAVVLSNAHDQAIHVTVTVSGLPGGNPPAYLQVREVLFTDTNERRPVAAALPAAERVGAGWRVSVPAGANRQVWFAFQRPSTEVPAGTFNAVATFIPAVGTTLRVPLRFVLYDLEFPTRTSLALGGWDYTNSGATYYRAPGNLDSLMALLRDHYVDTPWATQAVTPQGAQFDGHGLLTNRDELDLSKWDEWVELWHDAQNYYVFLSVGASFSGEPMGTARFERMVGEWFTAWAAHIRAGGIDTSRVGVLLVDEPHKHEQDQIIIGWARAIRAADTGILIFEDPTYRDPSKGLPEMFALCDVLCPNTPMMIAQGEPFRAFYRDQQAQGRTLWLYSCSGPAKLLDPCAYHRGQKWWAMQLGAEGSFYWALGCGGGIGDSWRAYAQTGRDYSPFFVGPEEVTEGKHMEAVREGMQDYEYFVLLRQAVEAARKRAAPQELLRQAEDLLTDGPRRVTATITSKALSWSDEADHDIMDQVRVEMLDMLMRLRQH